MASLFLGAPALVLGDHRGARCPLLGHIKLVTALFFDFGVYLIVVGLVLDVLRSLGARLDRRSEVNSTDEREHRPAALVIGVLVACGVYLLLERPSPGCCSGCPVRQRREPADPHRGGRRRHAADRRADERGPRRDGRSAGAGDGPDRDRHHDGIVGVRPRARPTARACSTQDGVEDDPEDVKVAQRRRPPTRRTTTAPTTPRPATPTLRGDAFDAEGNPIPLEELVNLEDIECYDELHDRARPGPSTGRVRTR